MTPEELMKPRYKVIADYPSNNIKVGAIIELNFGSDERFSTGSKPSRYAYTDNGAETEDSLNTYPHLFKRLEWWEERSQCDLPDYLKVLGDKERPIATGIYKVKYYSGDLQDHVRFECGEVGYLSWFAPATEQEYNSYQQSLTKEIKQ